MSTPIINDQNTIEDGEETNRNYNSFNELDGPVKTDFDDDRKEELDKRKKAFEIGQMKGRTYDVIMKELGIK